jgi:DNA-nicking Smr family endonuclease
MAKDDKKSRGESKSPPRRGQHLSDDERALWELAARDLKPIKVKKGRVLGVEVAPAEGPRTDAKPPAKPLAKPPAQPLPRAAAPVAKPSAPPLSGLDRKKTRKLGSGRVEIDARIDLHGMRQAEAHAVLTRFLLRAHASGRRWVLVITGKGGPRGEDEARGWGEPERGVLKRNVPRWLGEPELRAIVVGYTTAAVRHGGEGALYVQLRRKDRP